MELQEIFNKAVKHFAGMAEPSMDGTTSTQCAYRGTNGNKCVVGAFIPDELYDENLEGDAIDPNATGGVDGYHDTRITAVVAAAFKQKKLTQDQYVLLGTLQKIHDENADDWRISKKDDISWYEYNRHEIFLCGERFDLELGEVKWVPLIMN